MYLLLFYGIDDLTTRYLEPLYDMFSIIHADNGEQRLISNFGYANSVAIMLSFAFFLIIRQYVDLNGLKKSIFCVAAFICLTGILLSQSKAVIILFAFAILIFLILQKNKETRIQIIELITISSISAVVYSKCFETATIGYKEYIVFIILRNFSDFGLYYRCSFATS